MINIFDNYYLLNTRNTSYAFRVNKAGQLEHLYYGARISAGCKEDLEILKEIRGFAPGNTCSYKDYEGNVADPFFSPEDYRYEFSAYGKGDIREAFLEIVHKDGSYSSDFIFDSAKLMSVKAPYTTMPASYYSVTEGEDKCSDGDGVLLVTLKDHLYNLTLETTYSVFYETDVISRMTRLVNSSSDDITIKRMMSAQFDLNGTGYIFHTFNGAWTREMNHHEMKVTGAKAVNSTYAGTSSSRANPFVMIGMDNTSEDSGQVYGINLVYSGNHYEALEACGYNKTRFVTGINPVSFEWHLGAGETFEAPEAVMTFSDKGFNGMSHNMHDFVNNHIIRGKYKNSVRPVLLNSWEACYFDINEEKLLNLARKAKEVGNEIFVMDDGWFGKRNDDSCSLGDWYVNEEKLPGGLESLARKINELGLGFGIWVEPEMVNADSDLYRAHPEYVLQIPGKSHCEGRNQMILDLTNKEVRNYIVESMRKVFSSANIAYVKWDMNRIFTDVFSPCMPADRQGEVFHRYVLGLYEILDKLTREFPDILFEGCSSGGNRFDLGVLSYYPQIWASDDTDAYQRVIIQNGYSYGYPISCYTCHVSDVPNHQTRRPAPMETRFNVAAFGNLGYECNLNNMSDADNDSIKNQIKFYKEIRKEMLYGDFYRGSAIPKDNTTNWTIVSKDKSFAMNLIMQNRMSPNMSMNRTEIKGLAAEKKYKVTMINAGADRDFRMKEDLVFAYGDALVKAGMFIKPGFVGTGENENVMNYQDLGSRIFTFKEL